MTFKSYAQAGQFSTYQIDLPIKAEINEDLRAAGDFAKQMERSQKYREKWASSYLSALNNKSNIERQNRDDNFEFLQNNFKAIYEGEQREFEGRLAELRREQYEAANAEPSTIEKLLPVLMELAPMALSVIGQMKTAELQATNEWSQGIHDTFQQGGVTFEISELESMRNIAAKSPDIAEQMFKARVEGTGVGWQDLQRYTMLNGEALAFRNMNTGLTHLGKVEHLLRQETLAGGSLYAPSFAGNNTEYYEAYNKAIAGAKQHVFGDYKLNDATREAINKWEAGLRNDFERGAFTAWEGQAKVQYEQQQQHKFNTLVTQGDAKDVGNSVYQFLRTRKQYYERRGYTSQQAHEAAFTDIDKHFTDPSSLADSGDYQAYLDTFHEKRNEHIISQGGAPIEKGKGWAYETSAITMRKMVEKSFEITNSITKARVNEEQGILNDFYTKFNALPRGSAEAQNLVTQFQQEVRDSKKMFSNEFEREVATLGFTANKPKTFEEQTGMTVASLTKTAERIVLSPMQSAGSAHNNEQSKAYLLGLQTTQETISEVVANAQVNWTKYAGEFPHITNPEALRKEILTRSYKDLMDKGEIGLKNVNADGTAKVPAEAVTFKSIGGENPTGLTVQDFEDKAKQEGDKFYKTFTALTPTDRAVYDNYATIRGSMAVGENPDWRDMQMMANTQRMRSLKKVHKDKSIYEIMDLDLKSLGYEGLRTIPLNQAQIAANRGIAKRILEGSAGVTTTQNLRTANIITNGIQNKGKLVPVNIGGGRTVNLSNAGAAQALQAAVVAASQAGVDLSVIINNAGRTKSENLDAGGDPNSNHLWGGAIDINWNARGAYWWKENAHHFGFIYNPYSSKSTHYDFDATAWQQSPYSKQKLEPATVQPQQQRQDQSAYDVLALEAQRLSNGEITLKEFNETKEAIEASTLSKQESEEAPNQSMSLGDMGRGIADALTFNAFNFLPDQPGQDNVPKDFEPSFMTNGGILVGVRNGQKVKVQPGTTTPIPISDQMYEAMLEDRDKDKPYIPRATLSGGN